MVDHSTNIGYYISVSNYWSSIMIDTKKLIKRSKDKTISVEDKERIERIILNSIRKRKYKDPAQPGN